jgi:hypothetical protein
LHGSEDVNGDLLGCVTVPLGSYHCFTGIYLIKFSRAISRVNVESNANISKTSSVSMKMETELVFETLTMEFDSTLTQLITTENFIIFMRCESFKSYIGMYLVHLQDNTASKPRRPPSTNFTGFLNNGKHNF